MVQLLDHGSFPYKRTRIVAEGVACANVLTLIEGDHNQPAKDQTHDLWLMLDGEILNHDALAKRLGSHTASLCDAHLALSAYLRWGEDAFDLLNGQWNIVIHHARENRTLLVSDRMGSRILYFAKDGQRVVFSSELKAVIAGRGRRSQAGGPGLFEMFLAGVPYGRSTWVDGIHVLDPGTIVHMSARGFRSRRYWKFRFNEGGPNSSIDACADEFAARLKVACARTLKGHPQQTVGITLSGGLDSRAIALNLDRGQLPMPAFTYGDRESADVRFARQLAAHVGLDFHYVEEERARLVESAHRELEAILGPPKRGPRGFYSAQFDRMIWRDECMGDISALASVIWHPVYHQHMRVMLNGAAGDALTGSHLSWRHFAMRDRRSVIEGLREQCYWQSREVLEQCFSKAYLDAHWHSREALFERLFHGIDADAPAATANVWDMENRQRRGAFSTFTIERYFCTVRAPFLDYELAEFLATVPASWRFQQRLYKKMFVRAFPDARHIPWAYTGGKITDSPSYEFLREAYNFLKARAFDRGAKRWEFRDTNKLLRADAALSDPLEDWLSSDLFDPSVFNASGIRGLVQRFLNGEGGEELAVPYGMLCGLARAHQWFLSGDVKEVPPQADPARFIAKHS